MTHETAVGMKRLHHSVSRVYVSVEYLLLAVLHKSDGWTETDGWWQEF